MSRFLILLLSLSFSGTLMALFLFAVAPLVRDRLSKAWQYYIWLAVLARLILPVSSPASLSAQVFTHADGAVMTHAGAPENETHKALREAPRTRTKPKPGETAAAAPMMPAAAESAQGRNPPVLFFNLWLAGAAAAAVFKTARYRSFIRFIRAGCFPLQDAQTLEICERVCALVRIRKCPPLYVNPLAVSPMLAGIVRPILILPHTEFSREQMRGVLLHELTHYKRRDLCYKWLAQATLCLHWFNPVVFLAARRINRECELSCDEAVLRRLDREGRINYGDMLVRAVKEGGRYGETAAAVTLSENYVLLTERLGAIMNYRPKTKTAALAAAVLTLAVCLSFGAFGAYTPAAGINAARETAPYVQTAPAASDKQAELSTPLKTVRTALDALQKLDMRTFNACTDNERTEYGKRTYVLFGGMKDDYSKDAAERDFNVQLMRKMMEKMSYTLGEVRENGDTATVSARVSNVDQTSVMTNLIKQEMRVQLHDLYGDADTRDDGQDIMQKYYDLTAERVENGEIRARDVAIALRREKDGWRVLLDQELVNAATGMDFEEIADPSSWMGGLIGDIVGGVSRDIARGVLDGIFADEQDGDLIPYEHVNLPQELDCASNSTYAKELRFNFEVREPTHMTVWTDRRSGALKTGIQNRKTGTYPLPMGGHEKEGSVVLQPGSYCVVVEANAFAGSYHARGYAVN